MFVTHAAAKLVDHALTWRFVGGRPCGVWDGCGLWGFDGGSHPAVEPKATPVDAIFPDSRAGTCRPQLRRVGGLLEMLERLPDPRRRRGVRHRVAGIVAVALTAVLAGARSYAAIASWAADLTAEQRAQVGLTRPVAPDASTFRRVLARLDAVVLAGWSARSCGPVPPPSKGAG